MVGKKAVVGEEDAKLKPTYGFRAFINLKHIKMPISKFSDLKMPLSYRAM